MGVNYIISMLFLFVAFLLYKKKDNSISIISSIIFNICLLFCYNTLVVCFFSFIKLGGSILYYSIFNYIISIILFLISFKRKRIQNYYLDKKELLLSFVVLLTVVIIVLLRFDNFNSLRYATDDPAIHYKTSVMFSKRLEILNKSNSKDIIHGDFSRGLPIFYINCGMFFYLFSSVSLYKLFIIFDSFCLILYSLLFLNTLFSFKKEKNYLYLYVITMLYTLSYPLNNLIFGFCYLGLGVMVINLLIYFINDNKKELNKNIIFNLIILFILNYSMFFSYYLFMPPIYLSMGLYYIYLYRYKRLKYNQFLLYGIITLIIPFIIGVIYFIIPSFMKSSAGVFGYVGLKGFIYNNAAPIVIFIIIFNYLIRYFFENRNKINYFMINFYIFTIYVLIFLLLYIFKISQLYYFYKLFYPYYLFVFIFIFVKLFKKRYYIYYFMVIALIFLFTVSFYPHSNCGKIIKKLSIYGYNGLGFIKNSIIFSKGELEIVDNVSKYKKLCERNHEFLIVGSSTKNVWFYEFTGSIPIYNHLDYNREQLYYPSTTLYWWNNLNNCDCVVYFYENEKVNLVKDRYEILFENKYGAILKKK